jgi:hypothetical protein
MVSVLMKKKELTWKQAGLMIMENSTLFCDRSVEELRKSTTHLGLASWPRPHQTSQRVSAAVVEENFASSV